MDFAIPKEWENFLSNELKKEYVLSLKLRLKKEKAFIEDNEDIPEPEIWFHDIYRKDGTAYNECEVEFIKKILERS